MFSSEGIEFSDDFYKRLIMDLKLPSDKENIALGRFNCLSDFMEKRKNDEIELHFNSYKNHSLFLNITNELFQLYPNAHASHEYYLRLSTGDILKVDLTDNNRIAAKFILGTSELFTLRIGYFLLNSEQNNQFNEILRKILNKVKETAPYSKLALDIENSFPLRSFLSGFKTEKDYQFAQEFFHSRSKSVAQISNIFDKKIIKLLAKKIETTPLVVSLIKRFRELILFEEAKKQLLDQFDESEYFAMTEAFKANLIAQYGMAYYLDLNNCDIVKFDVLKNEICGRYKINEEHTCYYWEAKLATGKKFNQIVAKVLSDLLACSNLWERNLIGQIANTLLNTHS